MLFYIRDTRGLTRETLATVNCAEYDRIKCRMHRTAEELVGRLDPGVGLICN